MSELRKMLENAKFNDEKFILNNLNKEELVNKAAAQTLYIKELEDNYMEKMNEIIDLEIKIEELTKEKYSLILQNEKLEQNLLILNYKK